MMHIVQMIKTSNVANYVYCKRLAVILISRLLMFEHYEPNLDAIS